MKQPEAGLPDSYTIKFFSEAVSPIKRLTIYGVSS